jgi:hypothetical protein
MTNQNTYNIQILGGTVKIIDSTITNKGGRPINIYADNCENVRNITVENTTITNL